MMKRGERKRMISFLPSLLCVSVRMKWAIQGNHSGRSVYESKKSFAWKMQRRKEKVIIVCFGYSIFQASHGENSQIRFENENTILCISSSFASHSLEYFPIPRSVRRIDTFLFTLEQGSFSTDQSLWLCGRWEWRTLTQRLDKMSNVSEEAPARVFFLKHIFHSLAILRNVWPSHLSSCMMAPW